MTALLNIRLALLAALALGVLCPSPAQAASGLATTGVYGIDSAITLAKKWDIQFGTVKAGVADTYTISTAGSVTNAGSGVWLYGSPTSASVTISGSTTQTINISVAGLTANNGVTLQNPTCNYNSAGSGSCSLSAQAAPGAGKDLLIGIQAVVDGTQAAGSSAAPSFTVTATYP